MNAFSQLPWNQDVFAHLVKLEAEQKLGHAHLVQGQNGVGKESLARNFAAYLLCQNPQKEKACGECQSCHLLSAGTHPDFKYIAPEESASQIKIEQIRSSREFLSNTAMMGKYKILLIRSAEKMNINAANALLKNLEEPAAGTLLFLLSHQPGALLPTIKSRCQKIKISRPDEKLALSWLEQQLDKEEAKLNLQLAYGAPILALDYAGREKLEESRGIQKRLLELLKSQIVTTDAAKFMGAYPIESVLENFMLNVQQIVRHIHSKVKTSATNLESEELHAIVAELSSDNLQALHQFYNELLHARKMLQSTANPNPQLILESLCYHWAQIKQVSDKHELEGLAV